MANNKEVFSKELGLIYDTDLQEFIGEMLDLLPDYFTKIPASSSGKFHPTYALGVGGLVRHTKAAVGFYEIFSKDRILFSLVPELESASTDEINKTSDIVISSLILHDGIKGGWTTSDFPDHTSFAHPLLMGDYIIEVALELGYGDMNTIYKISNCIKSHMGQWNTNKYENIVLPKPQTVEEKIVHLCDYLASRKNVEFLF